LLKVALFGEAFFLEFVPFPRDFNFFWFLLLLLFLFLRCVYLAVIFLLELLLGDGVEEIVLVFLDGKEEGALDDLFTLEVDQIGRTLVIG